MMRRAFTLAELALASAMGAVLLLGCVTVFATLSRADQTHARRSRDIAGLERTQIVVQRSLLSLVITSMSNPEQTPTPTTRRATPANQPAANRPPTRPTLLLEPDPRLQHHSMTNPAASRQVVTVGQDLTPQRVELVVAEPPAGDRVELPPEAVPPGLTLSEGGTRGAFELIPTGQAGDGRTLWALTWRNFPPSLPEGVEPLVTIPPADPIVLAENLVYARWNVYHEMERRPKFAAYAFIDMPAYIELEMHTATGLVASWLFEIVFKLRGERQFVSPAVAAPETQPESAPPSRVNTPSTGGERTTTPRSPDG